MGGPLEGVRVLELSTAWAGPFCGLNLGFLGAEVIKVEGPTRPDDVRGAIQPSPGMTTVYPGGEPGERPWDRSGVFHERHRYKLGLSLDLTAAPGKEIFKRLVALSDVVLVNFRAGMMENLGLSFSALKAVNPGIIVVLMPGFGLSGPYQAYSSFGHNLEALTGAALLTGYPDRGPLSSNLYWPDPLVGILGVGAVVGALRHRSRTGEGMEIEFSQMEVAIRSLGGHLMDYAMNGRIAQSVGNRHPAMAPHGCYPCLGDDQWVALGVRDDDQWRALCGVMGQPELAGDPRFGEVLGRLRHVNELDSIVAAWTSTQDKMGAMHALQDAGVPAGAVLTHPEHFGDPHLHDRGFFTDIHHPVVGVYPFQAVNGFRLSKAPGGSPRPAPLFGQHNQYLLHDVLGLPEATLEDLQARQIISHQPLADAPRAR